MNYLAVREDAIVQHGQRVRFLLKPDEIMQPDLCNVLVGRNSVHSRKYRERLRLTVISLLKPATDTGRQRRRPLKQFLNP
jgi:hypothetical protein